jgi:hypothetical protein
MVSPERLAEMRAFADEIRDDLERRREEDPFFDLPPEVTREAPAIVHKVTDNSAYHSAEPASPAFDQETMINAIVEARDARRYASRVRSPHRHARGPGHGAANAARLR